MGTIWIPRGETVRSTWGKERLSNDSDNLLYLHQTHFIFYLDKLNWSIHMYAV